MTGEKRTETRMRCYNTVYSLYITSLQSYTMQGGNRKMDQNYRFLDQNLAYF